MSRLDEPVDRASVYASARLTIHAHSGGRRCNQCRPDGSCQQMVWALSERQRIREQAQARLGQTTLT